MRALQWLLPAFGLLGLLTATPALGRGPVKKDVDAALLRMPVEQLTGVHEAERVHRGAEEQLERIEGELAVAWLDSKASKAWVDAGESILRAIKAERKAAEGGQRTEELAQLAAQAVRSEASLAWRQSRQEAARSLVSFHQSRVSWAKAELDRSGQGVEVARMQAYNTSLGGDPDVEQEIGRLQTRLGRLAGAEGRERLKMERAEAEWQEHVARAALLDPSARSETDSASSAP